ncbi:hypothetical protein P3S67_018080 [Capsicum chacoense]
MSHVMNLCPPLINTVGNACAFFSYVAETEDEVQVPHFVAKLRDAKQLLRDKLKDMSSSDQIALHTLETVNEAATTSYERIFCTSLHNLGIYSSDFGWGKPIKVSIPTHPMKNNVNFLDDPNGGGINVIITLREADMLIFQGNKELLEFASPVVPSLE